MAQMERTSAWADVQAKAKRLFRDGDTTVESYSPYEIHGTVVGDTDWYSVEVHRTDAFGQGVTWYDCECLWHLHAHTDIVYPPLVARVCSHALSLFYAMQSLDAAYKKNVKETAYNRYNDTIVRKSIEAIEKLETVYDARGQRGWCLVHPDGRIYGHQYESEQEARDNKATVLAGTDEEIVDFAMRDGFDRMSALEDLQKFQEDDETDEENPLNDTETDENPFPEDLPEDDGLEPSESYTEDGLAALELQAQPDSTLVQEFIDWMDGQGYFIDEMNHSTVVSLAGDYAEENDLDVEDLTTQVFAEHFYDPLSDPTRQNDFIEEAVEEPEDDNPFLDDPNNQNDENLGENSDDDLGEAMGETVVTPMGEGEVLETSRESGMHFVHVAGIDYSGREFDDWFLAAELERPKTAFRSASKTSGKQYDRESQQKLIDEASDTVSPYTAELNLDGTHYLLGLGF